MNEISSKQITIHDRFWTPRQKINAEKAIFHQWLMLENSGCIDNFRIAARKKVGFREGWFFADSDAYKWLDAAARILAVWPSSELKELVDSFITLLGQVQMDDGYIFTYNQIHFPERRWDNLMIEHELYCHGHLIEAGVSHFEATGEKTALELAGHAADLLLRDFLVSTSGRTSGHEEIEIALLRLYQTTRKSAYLELARQFLERRGKTRPFALFVFRQIVNSTMHLRIARKQHKEYLSEKKEHNSFALPPENIAKSPRTAKIRWLFSALSGKFFQMHVPIRKQFIPVGHAVRFTYLQTAIAMLYRNSGDRSLLPALQKSWDRMVTHRMYITGGIGSLPGMEGFGKDYELDPEFAYAETCSALGSLFWNWEMTLITGEARYSDLLEWQLYNAAAVGMGLSGNTYLYNNPLVCRSDVTRHAWFRVPCCPSNLSRTWASLGKYFFSTDDNVLWIHQYIGCQMNIHFEKPLRIDLQSTLPWDGTARIIVKPKEPTEFTIQLRVPSWAEQIMVRINEQLYPINCPPPVYLQELPASGFNPFTAWFMPIRRIWSPGDVLDIVFPMKIILRHPSPRLHGHVGKVALSRGPLVYCLESVDNPSINIFTACLDPLSLQTCFLPLLLGGTQVVVGKTTGGKDLKFIPYFLWANRGQSQMTVWVKI